MKKIKNPAIFVILLIYFIGMVLTFFGELINKIQDVHYQNQIEKISNSENLEFSINEWNGFDGANEIKFREKYYDVISFEKINCIIIAHVVTDKFENDTRIILSKILNKSKIPHSKEKKLNIFSKHILLGYKTICENNLNFYLANSKIFNIISSSNIADYINFLEKPPCAFNFY